jgi:hypothetical protein
VGDDDVAAVVPADSVPLADADPPDDGTTTQASDASTSAPAIAVPTLSPVGARRHHSRNAWKGDKDSSANGRRPRKVVVNKCLVNGG